LALTVSLRKKKKIFPRKQEEKGGGKKKGGAFFFWGGEEKTRNIAGPLFAGEASEAFSAGQQGKGGKEKVQSGEGLGE